MESSLAQVSFPPKLGMYMWYKMFLLRVIVTKNVKNLQSKRVLYIYI